LLEAQLAGRVPAARGNHDPDAAPHGVYRCLGEDAWCAIAVFEEPEWRALCAAAGHPEWAADPRFASLAARKANEVMLDSLAEGWTAALPPREVMERLQAAGVRAGVVQSVADLFACPQLAERRQWRSLDHRELGSYSYQSPPFILSETPAELRRPSPLLGE